MSAQTSAVAAATEIKKSDHVRAVLLQAQKLMNAKHAEVQAQVDREEAEKELVRLNGSTTIELGGYSALNDSRFFECQGSAVLAIAEDAAQERGEKPSLPTRNCSAVVSFAGWQLRSDAPAPKVVLCRDCEAARDAAARKRGDPIIAAPIAPPPPPAPVPPAEEIPF